MTAAEHAIEVLETAQISNVTLVRAHLKRALSLAEQNRIAEALDENVAARTLLERICPEDAGILASIHHQRGFIFGQKREHGAARDEYRAAMRIFEKVGDPNGVAYMRCNAADCYYREGDATRAAQLTRESLATFRASHNWDGVAFALCNLAEFEIVTDDLEGAAASIAEALAAAQRLASETWLAVTAFEASALAAHSENHHLAARLYGYVAAWRKERTYHEAGDASMLAKIEALLGANLSIEERARLESQGSRLAEQDIIEAIRAAVDRAQQPPGKSSLVKPAKRA
jgi:tetratricopeptide (TPR) repeat protein